ncbi:hypothetical protein CP532_6216 [Ophiocordyceps camponoti-leonardi (nom. inval.)]|nr:hypothetical protein CP532_6216 [Ophiocordyceps camponoti-leonardi (nom. inval.)]
MDEHGHRLDTSSFAVKPRDTHHHSNGIWSSTPSKSHHETTLTEPDRFIVASYNVSDVSDPSYFHAYVTSTLSPNAVADVLVLQGVGKDCLSFLLSHSELCSRYCFSTHGLVDEASTGVVVLSRFRFSLDELLVRDRDESTMAVLEFSQFQPSLLLLAGCFGRSDRQLLLSYLATLHTSHPYIIAGHFSLESITDGGTDGILRQAGLQDSWLLSRLSRGESSSLESRLPPASDLYEGEEGSTYHPLTQRNNEDRNARPRRCNRILFNQNLAYRPSGFNIFGQSPSLTSHHRGIRCLFEKEESKQHDSMAKLQITSREAQQSIQATDELKAALTRHGHLPTVAEDQQRQDALRLLERILNDSEEDNARMKQVPIVVSPIGSFGLGVWTRTSHLDCLCIGPMSPNVFFTIAIQRLKAAGLFNLRRVKSASEKTKLEVHVEGMRFYLDYCVAPSIVESYPEVMKRPSTDPSFDLSTQTLAKLKPLRDISYLRRSIPDTASFRLSHLLIRAWAESRGVYATRFGLLGGFHITVMLVPVCKFLAMEKGGCVRASDIIRSFFHRYAEFDWRGRLVFDPFFHGRLAHRRTLTEPLCLLGWHGPRLNAATHTTDSGVDTITSELSRANSLLSREGITWSQFLGADSVAETPVDEFQRQYKSYINIEARHWAPSPQKRTKFFRHIESRLSAFLLDADRILPSVGMRFWPARLVQRRSSSTAEEEFTGYYLVGLYRRGSPVAAVDSLEELHSLMGEFEASIRRNSKYYDANSCWVMASIIDARDLRPVRLRPDIQGDGKISNLDEETDDDDESITEEKAIENDNTKKPTSTQTPTPIRFRPAPDVLNRLKWDPSLNGADHYLVGYEDRFAGVLEKSLEAWTGELTHDDFIPQHRILYFRRKGDGEIVWDRRSRLDLIFGSGLVA